MPGARRLLERAIRMLDELAREDLDEETKSRLLEIRGLLVEALAKLIGAQHACAALVHEALRLAGHLDISLVEPASQEAEASLKERLLAEWEPGTTKTYAEIEALVGEKARNIIDELLKDGVIKVAKIEWVDGELVVHYERVAQRGSQ